MTFFLLQLVPDWAPNVHPILVHFPIAIFFFAALVDFLSFFLPKEWWDEQKTAITYLIGGIFVVIVFFSGKMAADSLDIPKVAYQAVGTHAGWAKWTVWFFGIYAALRFIFVFIDKLKGLTFHIVMFALSLVGLFFLYETGEHGGKLVFHYGLGTQQVAKKAAENEIAPQKPGFHKKDKTISWIVDEDAPQSLNEHFTFLQGDTSSINAKVVQSDSGYYLQMQSPHYFFVTGNNSYANMQMELTIDPRQYKGKITLVHHVHDTTNYDYMKLSPDGSAQLGRYQNGEKTVIDKGSFNPKELKQIKLAVSGRHIHGYVNGKGILHGHANQTGPGAVGLKLDGSGTFALNSMEITAISGDEKEGHAP